MGWFRCWVFGWVDTCQTTTHPCNTPPNTKTRAYTNKQVQAVQIGFRGHRPDCTIQTIQKSHPCKECQGHVQGSLIGVPRALVCQAPGRVLDKCHHLRSELRWQGGRGGKHYVLCAGRPLLVAPSRWRAGLPMKGMVTCPTRTAIRDPDDTLAAAFRGACNALPPPQYLHPPGEPGV